MASEIDPLRLEWKSYYLDVAYIVKRMMNASSMAQKDKDAMQYLLDFMHDTIMGNDWTPADPL